MGTVLANDDAGNDGWFLTNDVSAIDDQKSRQAPGGPQIEERNFDDGFAE